MFDSIRDRLGLGRGAGRDDYDDYDDYGYDDEDDPDGEPQQGYDRYAPVTTRNAGMGRRGGEPYTDRAESELGQRRYSATHPALVSRRDIRQSSHVMGRGEIPERFGRESAGRASDYAASGSETDYHVDTPPDQVASDIDAEEEAARTSRGGSRRSSGLSLSRFTDRSSEGRDSSARSSARRPYSSRAERRSSDGSRRAGSTSGWLDEDDARPSREQRASSRYDAPADAASDARDDQRYTRPGSQVGITQRERTSTPVARMRETGVHRGSFINKAARDVVIVAPQDFNQVERVSIALKAGNAVVLDVRATKRQLAKRVLDFSFGVASALDGRVDSVADMVFAITRGSGLTDGELQKLHDQGVA